MFLLPSHYFSLVKKLFGGQQIDLANILVGLISANNQNASVCNTEALLFLNAFSCASKSFDLLGTSTILAEALQFIDRELNSAHCWYWF